MSDRGVKMVNKLYFVLIGMAILFIGIDYYLWDYSKMLRQEQSDHMINETGYKHPPDMITNDMLIEQPQILSLRVLIIGVQIAIMMFSIEKVIEIVTIEEL